MNEFHHAIVWIDHQKANVLRFGPAGVDSQLVHSTHRHEHLHHKANSSDSGRAPQDHAFLQRVGESLSGTAAILVTGPANAKSELVSFLQAHQPATAGHIVAVQPLDHPSDGQLEAYARKFFHADERMHLPVGIHQ
jgi:stalled ribosome rescue protein Dom34